MSNWTKISEVKDYLSWMKKKMSPAMQEGAREWAEEEFPKRFQFGNTNEYNYIPNTREYERQKLRDVGRKPQLVRNGRLRDRVVTSVKVNKNFMIIQYPRYGRYLIQGGRDFTIFRDEDIENLFVITAKRLEQWLKKKK